MEIIPSATKLEAKTFFKSNRDLFLTGALGLGLLGAAGLVRTQVRLEELECDNLVDVIEKMPISDVDKNRLCTNTLVKQCLLERDFCYAKKQ